MISLESTYDPSMQSRAGNSQAMRNRLLDAQQRIEDASRAGGDVPFAVRNYERDAALTYLRIVKPNRWSWAALAGLVPADTPVGKASRTGAASSRSLSGVISAVERVMELLEIEAPSVPRGRPRRQ